MNHDDDDEMFSILERAIGPTSDDAPTDAQRRQLRSAVDEWRRHRPVPITAARSRRWIRRTVATGIGGIVVLSGATAVAAAVNDGVLPTPARTVARSIGLPVESSDLARARAALGRLRKADDTDRDTLEIEVEDALSRLSASELSKINEIASSVLEDAHDRDEQLSSNSGSGSSNSGPGSGSSVSGSSGSGSGDSGSSGSGSSGSGSSGSGSSGSGSGEESTTSTTARQDDHDVAPSTSTTEDHSGSGDGSASTTDADHSGEGGGGGGGSGSGKDGGGGDDDD
jgi:hypothetical protein